MLLLLLTGLSGLVVGSFLCLAVDRYRPGVNGRQWLLSLASPPSHCATCNQRLAVRDLIPVYSWCRMQGRCRYCQITLPQRLLLTEILTSLLFTLLAGYQPSLASLLFSLLFSAALIVLGLIDRQYLLLPDAITLPLLWLGLLYHLLFFQAGLASAVTGALLGWLCLWLLYWGFRGWYRREGIGYGDMKLFAALGAWCGWQALPLIATVAAVLGLSRFAFCYWQNKAADWHCRQPFGPCLAIAGWIMFVWQTRAVNAIPLP